MGKGVGNRGLRRGGNGVIITKWKYIGANVFRIFTNLHSAIYFLRHGYGNEDKKGEKFLHRFLLEEKSLCRKSISKKKKRENKRKEKATRVVNMLINADSFSSRFKENERVFKIKKRRRKEKKERRKIFSDETLGSRSKFYYAPPSSSLGDPLTNFDFSQLFDVEI